jgi:hypothetical protein
LQHPHLTVGTLGDPSAPSAEQDRTPSKPREQRRLEGGLTAPQDPAGGDRPLSQDGTDVHEHPLGVPCHKTPVIRILGLCWRRRHPQEETKRGPPLASVEATAPLLERPQGQASVLAEGLPFAAQPRRRALA